MIVVRHGKEHGEGGVGLGVEQTTGAGAHHVSLRASTTAPLHSESFFLGFFDALNLKRAELVEDGENSEVRAKGSNNKW